MFRIWQRLNDLEWKLPTGETIRPSLEQKTKLFETLFFNVEGKSKFKLTISKIGIFKVSASKITRSENAI